MTLAQPSAYFGMPFISRVCSVLFLALFGVFTANAQLTVSITKTDPTCNGFTNGTAAASATGGAAPYTFQMEQQQHR